MRMLIPLLLISAPLMAAEADWQALPGSASFETVLRYQEGEDAVAVAPFELMRTPVSNAAFLDFVERNPEWQRGRVAQLFAEARYLQHWQAPLELGPDALPTQPVTRVSWFAADAYCRELDARLPTWLEWEYASAADATRVDARQDPAWREEILAWYSRPSNAPLPETGSQPPNFHGVQDLNGLVWEWVEDHAALLVSSDNREQGDPDLMRFCGAGALSTQDRENYAVLMRIAMLSALEADDVTGNLGFRCARDVPAAVATSAGELR